MDAAVERVPLENAILQLNGVLCEREEKGELACVCVVNTGTVSILGIRQLRRGLVRVNYLFQTAHLTQLMQSHEYRGQSRQPDQSGSCWNTADTASYILMRN